MTYAELATSAFFIYLLGCFLAFALSLRSSPDNRALAFVFGAWICSAFAAHHLLVPHAAQRWGAWWYVWNMCVAAFPILPAWMLKDCHARKPFILFAVLATMLCGVYALFMAVGDTLPGAFYFYSASILESCEVLSLVIWSGPVIPLFVRAWNAITKRSWPWTHHRLVHRV